MIGIGGGILLAVGIGDLSDNEKFQYEEVTTVVVKLKILTMSEIMVS